MQIRLVADELDARENGEYTGSVLDWTMDLPAGGAILREVLDDYETNVHPTPSTAISTTKTRILGEPESAARTPGSGHAGTH